MAKVANELFAHVSYASVEPIYILCTSVFFLFLHPRSMKALKRGQTLKPSLCHERRR